MLKPMLPLFLVSLALTLACRHPASDILRQQPSPALHLELYLPDQPEAATMKQAYGAALRNHFAKGLGTPETAQPGRIQLLVMVGNRLVRSEAEARLNNAVDLAGAIASASPLRLLHNTAGPRSDYESQVERLGYRPGLLSVQVVLLKVGNNGFQETIKLKPSAILERMRPLGEKDRTTAGILAEEGQALALETLAMLQKQAGWKPPAA